MTAWLVALGVALGVGAVPTAASTAAGAPVPAPSSPAGPVPVSTLAAAPVPAAAVPLPALASAAAPVRAATVVREVVPAFAPALVPTATPVAAAAPATSARVCPVPEGPVRARATLADGTVVVARDGALELRAPGTAAVRRVTACDGLPDAFPISLAPWRGGVAVGFRAAGLYAFDGAHFTRVTGVPAGAVRALAASADTLWVGTATAGLWRVAVEPASSGDPAPVATPFDHRTLGKAEISALALDGRGDLHVGAGVRGWWRVRRNKAVRRERDLYAGCFVATQHGTRPVAPGPGCDLGPASPASGLPSGHIAALAWHRGRLVVGTFDQGLAVRGVDGRFTPVAGSPPFVNALLSDGDDLWIATAKGLWRQRRDEAPRALALGLASAHVNGLALAPDGTLWLATGRGLAAREPGGRVRSVDKAAGLPSHLVYAVAVAADGAVWAGTAGGAARLGPEGVRVFTQASGALTHDWVNALLPDGEDGGVLAGTYDAGVVRLTPDGAGAPVAALAGLWVNPSGLATLTGGGLAVATLGDGLALVAATGAVSRPVALPSDDVTSVAPGADGLWVGTRGGLVFLPAR